MVKRILQNLLLCLLLIVVQLFAVTAFGQDDLLESPPPPAVPTAENKMLIDSLVKESKFDLYFENYASSRIMMMGYEKKWNDKDIEERKSRIDFSKFMSYTVYNSFALLTAEELKELITIMGKLNKNKEYSFYVFSTSGIESNMDLYVRSHYLE